MGTLLSARLGTIREYTNGTLWMLMHHEYIMLTKRGAVWVHYVIWVTGAVEWVHYVTRVTEYVSYYQSDWTCSMYHYNYLSDWFCSIAILSMPFSSTSLPFLHDNVGLGSPSTTQFMITVSPESTTVSRGSILKFGGPEDIIYMCLF